jgi:hypothetical protein
MHKGEFVYITKTGRFYHYTDDDCPVYSSIKKGKKQAKRITETEAKAKGLTLCRHCKKEYAEDMRERGRLPNGQNIGCLVFIAPIVAAVGILHIIF